MTKFKKLILTSLYLLIGMAFMSINAHAVPMFLDNSISCNGGTPLNGITTGDVTGNAGGSSNCWGTYNGNDPGPSGDGFQIGSTVFDFVAKQNTPGTLEGADIGLIVSPVGGAPNGTWSFDSSLFDPSEFLIVLKAASSPGYAAWLFTGDDAASNSGTWLVAWTNKSGKPRTLSHLAVYAPNSSGGSTGGSSGSTGEIPEPSILLLFGSGLIWLGWKRRKA